ncbi:uncharacterized protein [Ptychodera flava]|uniref:uncharacterized protein n=1 Tax=Ptychodera flava TaxID=63121 RepID=UPI00396A4920
MTVVVYHTVIENAAEMVVSITTSLRSQCLAGALIHAVNRQRPDGRPWKPSDWMKVCNTHFVDGVKSDDPSSPSYIPSIFPWKRPSTSERRVLKRTYVDYRKPISGKPSKKGSEDGCSPSTSNDDGAGLKSNGHVTVSCPSDDRVLRTAPMDHQYTGQFEESEEMMKLKKEDGSLYLYVQGLQTENSMLKELNSLQSHKVLSLDVCKDTDDKFQFYTGFPSYEIIFALFEYLEQKAQNLQYWRGNQYATYDHHKKSEESGKPGPERKLSLEEEFFLVIVRLKLGLLTVDLAYRFGISQSTVSRVFTTWINFLYTELFQICTMPDRDELNQHKLLSFSRFPDTRVVIDCTEMFTQSPSSLTARKQVWSEYKHHNTVKFLIGIGPNGAVTYVSNMWGGRASDKYITKNSDFLDYLSHGDAVMADRGFTVSADLSSVGVSLNIPAFKGSERDQLLPAEIEHSRRIAEARIHIERAIGRIKNFHIFDSEIKLTMKPLAEQIFTVCAFLINFQSPFMRG